MTRVGILKSVARAYVKQKNAEKRAMQAAIRKEEAAFQRAENAKNRDMEALRKAVTPATFFNRLSLSTLSDGDKSLLTYEFLARYWEACKTKSDNAKTDASRRKALQAYFDTLRSYDGHFTRYQRVRIQGYQNEFDRKYGEGVLSAE